MEDNNSGIAGCLGVVLLIIVGYYVIVNILWPIVIAVLEFIWAMILCIIGLALIIFAVTAGLGILWGIGYSIVNFFQSCKEDLFYRR